MQDFESHKKPKGIIYSLRFKSVYIGKLKDQCTFNIYDRVSNHPQLLEKRRFRKKDYFENIFNDILIKKFTTLRQAKQFIIESTKGK